MKIPTDSLGSSHERPIPPLSQSRHGDMACQALYVRKHVQCARVGESEPAARGIEIHQILATYINHLVRAKGVTDLEVLDVLMRGVGTESREVLDKFRDNHAFDPEKILATELHIALDENCDSYIEPSPGGIDGTSSSQIGYAELNDFRRTLLAAEVRNRAQRVVEAVGEISGADHQRELNNLTFVVILAQLLERTGADRGSTAGDPLGVKNRGLLFFVEE